MLSNAPLVPQATAYPKGIFPHMESHGATAVAVKVDDAVVLSGLWDDQVWTGAQAVEPIKAAFQARYGRSPLNAIQKLALRAWKRNVRLSFMKYMRDTHGDNWTHCPAGRRDREVGRDCLWRVISCDWWEWPRGSTLFFWRWPRSVRMLARDGHPVWWIATPPASMKLQPPERDPVIREKVKIKLQNVRDKRYICPGPVQNVTSYFAVPKGDSDIQLVNDATKSGLNRCIWVPSFALPPTEAMTDSLTEDSWMLDHDIGEMFLNFPMHESIQPYSGIDVRPYCYPGSTQTHIERWVRCMMGSTAAPYVTTQCLALAKEVVYGDKSLPDNPFGWTRVRLNLPEQPEYTPTLPWVRRVTVAGSIASDSPTYVDDARIIGSSLSVCRQAGHRFATGMCYLGIQVAARKVRPPSQTPAAWAGAVALVGPEGMGVTCLPEKWTKTQAIVADTLAEVHAGGLLHHKTLEQRHSFLNHVQRVFPVMTPFLKGFHLTLDGWRLGRDNDLWKTNELLEDHDISHRADQDGGPPEWVTPAPRLQDDLLALEAMFQGR
jgi:hypothetical protein